MKVYQKVHKFTDVISHFCTREWTFTNGNVQSMWDRLDSKDQQIFRFNMKNFNWDQYFETYLKGIRVYLFKDDLSTLEQSKIRWKRWGNVELNNLQCNLEKLFFYETWWPLKYQRKISSYSPVFLGSQQFSRSFEFQDAIKKKIGSTI